VGEKRQETIGGGRPVEKIRGQTQADLAALGEHLMRLWLLATDADLPPSRIVTLATGAHLLATVASALVWRMEWK
jgi:hypothetical protein